MSTRAVNRAACITSAALLCLGVLTSCNAAGTSPTGVVSSPSRATTTPSNAGNPVPTGTLHLSGPRVATHVSAQDDRCLEHHAAGSGSLAFFTASAEDAPTDPYVLFSLAGYHGPGTYPPTPAAKTSPSGYFTWSFSRWDMYVGTATVTVDHDDGSRISGSVQGTLSPEPQASMRATLSGTWSCTLTDPTPPVVKAAVPATVASAGRVAFRYPQGWSAAAGSPIAFTAGTPHGYVSPQPLLPPCFLQTGLTFCTSPIVALRPDSMLVGWFSGFLPGYGQAAPPGSASFTTGAGTGWIVKDAQGCVDQLGDEELSVVVPSQQLRITACIRGPQTQLLESEAEAIIRTSH